MKAQSKGKVLVVDDEEDIVALLTEMLTMNGYEAKGYTKPAEALDALEEEDPDVLFFDYKMPLIDGLEALKRVRETAPNVPVVFISGYLTKESLLDAIRLGIYGVIEKPFSDTEILKTMASAVEDHRSTIELESKMKDLVERIA